MSTLVSTSDPGDERRIATGPFAALAARRQNQFSRKLSQQVERRALVRLADAREYEWEVVLAAEMLGGAAEETARYTERCVERANGDGVVEFMLTPLMQELPLFCRDQFRAVTRRWR